MLRVCFHGAESTGKSVLAARLHHRFGWPWVPEYGRDYCERNGTDLSMADLLAIAEGHQLATEALATGMPDVLISDTDQLMTAAWAAMLFDEIPGALLAYPKADLYLLFETDVPWLEDGTRLFGSTEERRRFGQLAEAMLRCAGVSWMRVGGSWEEREAKAITAIAEALAARRR